MQQKPADSVLPVQETCTAWGSEACIDSIRSGGPTLTTTRSADRSVSAKRGWRSTGNQIVSKAGKATVQRSSPSCASATSGA